MPLDRIAVPGLQPGLQPTTYQEAKALLAGLSPQEREQLEDLISSSDQALWSPNPGPQAMAYYSEADEVFYGGSSGGGKSSLIIGLALTQHQRSLIVRLESTQLRGMIDDMARILKTRDGLNRQDGQWRIPQALSNKPDQLVEFGGVPNPGDEERHQGIAHDLLAIDEATQLPEYVVDYLSTWNRTTLSNQRTRIVLTSNPPTPSTAYRQRSQSGAWIIRRYAPWLDPQYRDRLGLGPAAPGELRWYATIDGRDTEWPDPFPFLHERPDDGPEVIYPKSRTFIPARVTDNPFLVNDANYISQLQKLPEPLRSAMLYGDFSLSLSDRPLQMFPSAWVRAAINRWEQQTSNPATRNAPLTALGFDVSRSGKDSSVISPRYGPFFDALIVLPPEQTRSGPDAATQLLRHHRPGTQMVIDANGVGASAYDYLHKTLNFNAPDVQAYVGSVRSTRRDRSGQFGFVNRRSEAYWALRESIDPASPYPISLPPDDELVHELSAMTWTEQSGKIKAITKDDVIKALGRSPDKMDALVLSHMARDEDANAVASAREAREARLEDARARGPYGAPQALRPARKARWGDHATRLPYPERW
jgi:hypothetical protein